MEAPEDALLEAEPLPTDASDDDADAPASSGPASTPTSSTSSPPAEPPSPRSSAGQGFGPLSGPSLHSQSPHSGHAPARRGPGRPRKDPARPVRRYRTPMGSMRGFKRHRGSRDDSLEDLFDDVDLLASTPEEPPYFPEKWPGKVCALCNLSQRSQLGQGEMLQINCDVSGGISPGILAPPLSPSSSTPTTPTSVPSQNTLNLTLAAGRRQKNINKCKMPSSNPEHTDELSIIGYPESMEIMAVVDCGYIYLHKGCMDWSSPAESQAPGTLEIDRTIKIEDCLGDVDEGVKSIVAIALQRKCSFCLRWGASISCRMSCTKYFHYPCVLASGGFQEITTKSSFCKEHVYQVPLVCSADIDCHTCGLLGDIANLMTCCSCNAHHHGTCVGLPQLPGVRAGWNCKQCRVCQVCHGVGTDSGESKAIGCEQCDKLYHASCIRPIMTTIPKYGWKCKCCRVCSDCGSRSPGAGASSRWHAHYTVCDSCYQQRNKGLSCPLCRRAYRAAAQREMVQCSNCKRFVHGTCDADADLKTYQQKKETIPEYDYVCPVCTTIGRTPLQRRKDSIDDENLSASQESLYDDVIMDQDPLAFESKMDIGLGKGKPYSASKIAKKKIGAFKFRSNYGGSTTGKLPFNKRQRGYFMDFGRKRGAKTRMRGMFGIPGLGLQRPQAPDNKNGEDEPGVENKLVLCSSKDKFVLTQDVCVMCGALGTDSEGILIACAQCGQTYHPYCVSVKVTSVIVQKGWRCLDCTACEGCGRRDDEARLVLCDDCDVSFHTYCARPTLPAVPRGCWRCTRCRRCITCGTTQPGPDNMWMNGYTECGPCASLVMCAVCGTPYGDGELILQCAQCRRWLHAACDTVHSEQEADICCQRGYSCLLCRPRECPPPHLVPVPTPVPALPAPALTSTSLPQQALTPARPASPGEYFLDGVCLSAGGLRAIRALQGDGSTALGALHGRKKRRQRFEGPFDKSAGILATIESVVQGGDCDISNEESKIDINDIKEEQGMCLYKEGMIWIVAQDGPPPEGFTTYTTESGKTVLRRKRQRNLNRVGIGGFTVRVRSQGRGSRGGEGELPPNSSEGPDSVTPTGNLESPTSGCISLEKRKKPRRKPRSRLMEAFPSYMQEAFFGRDLLDLPGARIGELDTSINVTDSEGEDVSETMLAGSDNASTINLNQDELLAIEATRIKEEKEKEENDKNNELYQNNLAKIKVENESEDVSGNDLHVEDVKSIKNMILSNEVCQDNPDIESITAMKKDPINTDVLNSHQKDGMNSETNAPSKEDMSILGVNLENMVRESLPNMDSRDVEEIFKGVLTDDSQESQESSVSFVNSVSGSSSYNPQRRQLSSPMEFPSPYHTEYSGSSQLSPAFSESSGQWSASGTVMNSSCATGNSDIIGTDSSISQPPTSQTTQPTTYNQRSTEKMKADEGLGSAATISAVLYANINYPEWKTEFPNWPDRCKQILKKWRALASDKKTPYLQQARDNRGAIRMKKAQQISKESNAVSGQAAPESGVPTAPAELPATLPDQSAEVPLDKDGLNLTHASATNTPSPAIVPQAPSPDSNTFNKSSSPVTTNTVTSSSSVVTGFTSGHFTLNHQFMPFYHGSNGPAPNVTVNPFGKFTTAGGGTHHKTIGRSITPGTTPGPHLTLGIVQQAQAQTPAASLVRHNITGALFSQALSFLGKSHVLPHSISSIMHSGGSTHKGVADGNCDNAVRSRSSSPMSPCGDIISDSTPLTSAPASAPPSPPGDLHIRVLTPSEIMRTLPSMPQELAYEPPIQTTEQEKLSGQQRGAREAEQERQWKQLQQLRQQQQQHQQQVIHDQRLQAMARVQRQINTDGSFPSEQLQVSINEQSPLHPGGVTSHSPTMPRSPYPSTNNVGRFTHPPLVQARPPTAPQRLVQSPFSPQSPHDPFPGSVSPAQNQSDPFQRPPSENSGEYLHSPQTPRSFGHQSPNPARSPAYVNQTRMVTNINSQENYTQPPGTPRPGTQYSIVPQRNQIYAPRPQDPFLPPAQNPALLSPRSEGSLHPPEVNRQLRDLLQRQQNPSNKIWSQGDDQSITNQHSIEQQQITEGQFRQPLPVSPIVRPRVPVAPQEPRTRLILQNTPGGIQQQQQQRMLSPLQQQQLAAAAGHAILNVRSRTPVVESPKQQSQNTLPNTHSIIQGEKNILVNAHQPPKVNMGTPSPLLNNSNQKGTSAVSTQQINNSSTPIGNTSQSTEEMPDMDIDKLEQDNANMAEVGDLLGGLGDDEEELLVSLTAEMGDDFNILEYADPELADFGDTSNILDGLELTDDSDTTQGKHVKRDPVEDSSEETKSNIKHDSPIIKAEKKEEEESTGDKRVKLEPNIEGETNENQSIQIIHQKQELVESGVSAQHVTLPRLDIIHSTQPQSSSLSQNPSLIQNQHMRFQQTFRTNIAPTHLQVQGKLQQSQPNQFGLAQKIGNRQMGQIINVNQQNQFNQMNINKQTAVVVGQQTNIPVNQNQQVISTSQHHQIVQQIIARQTDQSQSLEQLTQHSQNQVQFTPNQQQIRGQFVPPQQQLAQQLQQQAAIQQQMQSQVAAAIASGRPMAPGTRLMSPDGAVGVVTSNNSVTVTYPSAFAHHRPQHGRVGVGMGLGIRNVVRAAPPPPPPPYPGTTQRLQAPPPPPPPPYPSQISLEVPSSVYGVDPWSDWLRSRRPLLLQEQPLLLEDLVEQEKREQGRQVGVAVESSDSVSTSSSVSVETPTPQQQWQQPTTPTTPPQQPQVGSVPLYNIPHLAAPPLPPERITTDSDRQAQLAYEQWLQGQNTLLTHQLKYYETEVQKLRKIRKSLNSKQRQLRKSGNELAAGDAAELARISGEQAVLQKHLESARKQCRQHSMLIQEYRNKQQQQTQIQQTGGIIQQQINIVQGNITQQQSSVGQQQQQSNIVQQINVNQQQININQSQINTGQQQINTGQQQINSGKQQINTGKQINTVQQQINTVQQQINTGQQQINTGQQQINTGQQLNMGQQINTSQQQINIGQQVNMVQQMNIGQVNVNQVNNGKGIFNQVLTQMQQQQSQQQQHQQQHQQHQQQHQQQQQQQQISLMQTLQHTNSNQTQLMQQQVNQQNQVTQQLHLSQQTQNQINQQHGSIIQQQRINVMNSINQVVQQSQGNQQIQQISVSNQSSSPQMQTHLQIVNQQQQIIGIHQQNQLDKLTGNQTLHQINQLQNLNQGQRPMSSPSPQMTVQLQQNIQSPVTSHSPQLQSMQSGSLSGGASPHTGSTPPPSFSPQSGNGGRSPQVVFPRPQGSPLQNRFVRPPTHHGMHQQGMRVGVTFNTRQSSPLGSPQPLMSPGASQNETQRQQMMQRQQYSPMGQPPSSPLSRSPLIGVQPPSSPMSVRSPLVTTQTTPSPSPQPDSMSGGGGNPHALHNPIPLPPNLSTYRYFKLGLRGGSPMWGHNKPMKRLISNDPTQGSSNQQADQGILTKPKKESHLNKVSILKKKSQTKVSTHNVTISNVKNKPLSSFANMECNELDDSSCTPPVSPGKIAQALECTNEMKGFEKPSSSEEPKMNMKTVKVIPEKNVPLIDCIQQSDEEIVLIESSPDENKHQILDYDDENDKNFVGAEVSLSAAAGDSDQGDLSVLEPFPQVEITEIASPLDSQEYILFSSDVVDYAVDSDDSLKPISFIQKDDSVVISYSRQTSESNGESNMHSPLEGSEDENNCIHNDEIIEKSSPTQAEKNSIQIEDVNHESIDSEIVVISSNVGSPEEHIATEEDFEELIDSGKPEDSPEGEIKESPSEKISLSQSDPPTSTVTRTETTKKTVAVISLAAKPPQSVSGVHQFKIVNTGKPGTGIARLPLLSAVISPHSNTKILNEVSQATVASVSIANQTISVPVLKSLNVPIVPLSSSSQGNLSPVSHLKKVPITITASSLNLPSKPISSVISVISSNIPRMAPFNPVITLATTNPSTASRMPIPIITQKHIQQKIVKALDKPTTLTISSSKLSSLAVSQDVTLPAKIFQDESASPDSSLSQDESNENDGISSELSVPKDKATKDILLQSLKKPINTLPQKSVCSANQNIALASQSLLISNADHSVKTKDVDIENEITKHTELPQKSLLLSKLDIPKSPERISEKIPDNIMEGDDEKVTKSDECEEPSKYLVPNLTMQTESVSDSNAKDSSILSNMKTNNLLNANPSKDMVLDSNMGIASELTQDSIQISIPSPTSSQERYLDNITLQAHNTELNNTVSISQKQVQQFKEMIDIWNNISGEPKVYPIKLQDHNLNSPQESSISAMLNRDNDSISDIDDIIRQDLNNSITTKPEHNQEALKSTIPVHVIMRTRESSQSPITVATSRITTVMPQLSPLSKPTELTTNIANASQQLRTIMSSINTSKVESTVNSTVTFMKKGPSQDLGTTTQVNFENLLPSTKVEVMAGKSTNRGLIEKAVLNSINSTTENSQSISSIIATSRISSLTTSAAGNINRNQHSPLQSPSGSPRHSPLLPAKSPIHSPLLLGQSVSEEQPNITSQTPPINQQAIQMPALSKIPTNSSQALSTVIQTNVPNSTTSILHKNQLITTNILSSTLLQTAGRHNQNNMQIPVHSLSQPPALIMSSRPATILSTNQISNLTTSNTNSITITSLAQSIKTQSGSNIISSKLLHSQLTSPLKRSKSTDEPKTEITSGQMQPNKRHSLESVIVKSEPMDCDDINSGLQSLENSGCKFSSLNLPQKPDESQNVLLKQLLQSSGGNSPTVTPARTSVSSLLSKQRTAPTLGLVPSLEAQLARPLIPPPHLPITTTVEPAKTSPRQTVSRETSFVPRMPQATTAPLVVTSVPMTTQSSTHSLMDVRKPPNKPIIKEEPPSTPTTTTPTTPMSISSFALTGNEILSPTIKKEVIAPQQSPVNQPFVPLEVKKELLDESSQQSAISGISTVSDQGKLDTPLKEELSDTPNNIDTPIESGTNQETALEAKKRKRREYQQKRRQMQNNQKIEANNNKKRPRKGSKVEEDYDTYIDSLMNQLRQLPPMQVQEPMLGKNYGVCPVFGSGDLSKIGIMKDYSIKYGDLNGEFGNAYIPNITDFYNTKPFGEEESIPEKPPISTQRGFYDQEFSPIRLESENDEKKMEFICKERDIDTPDTIVSSSSPECCVWDNSYPFPGLKLIDESESDEEVERSSSPIIPIITPIPIRVKSHQCDIPQKEMEKENVSANVNKEMVSIKSKVIGTGPSTENEENVTVTLTLTSAAAEDILGVLRELAGILHIPPPTAYQIVERTTTPPSHKLGLYRSKGKDGKEGAPIDIQSILNGEAKFCRHCDVVIMDSVIKAKASEFPLLSSFKSTSNDLLGDVESDLFFCSTQCYKRFAWTPTNIIVDNKSNMKFQENENSLIPNMDIKIKDDFDAGSVESMDTEDVDLKPSIKGEKIDLSFMDSIDNEDLVKHGDEMTLKMEEDSNSEIKLDEKVIKEELMDKDDSGPPSKLFRGMQYKFWSPGCIVPPTRYKKPSDREITEMVFRTGVTVMPARLPDDLRKCSLCHSQGDGIADGPARLLNYDVDKWVHLNCALWSDGVYETVNGALMNFDNVLQTCSTSTCVFCERNGATVRCFKTRCTNIYHLSCAVKHKCVFHKNKTAHCPSHIPKGEKENELTTLSVQRRVYVQRDESRQVAAVMQLAEPTYLLRVGGLIFLSVGQLLPHQLPAFHSPNYIYPIGYQTIRFYWSTKRINTRCRYICSIVDKGGRPEFVVTPQEGEAGAAESRGSTPRGAWAPLLNALSSLRATQDTLRLWPDHLTGEDLFGLTEPAIVRVLESLPGIDTLTDYRFKYGRNPLLELPLAVNPSGAARTEARAAARGAQWRRALAVRAPPPAPRLPALPLAPPPPPGEHACPYSKQFVHSKSSQYKKMKQEWRNNVYLARSKIQGLGLYAARDIEKHTMVIEYIGEVIRSELSEIREKKYEDRNRGIYMFRLDEERVVDATLSGGLARYINHSCNPNCVAEAVEVERDLRIIIFAKRRINRGEELAYDYKFDIEDDAHKISCMCGAPNCRKWMN